MQKKVSSKHEDAVISVCIICVEKLQCKSRTEKKLRKENEELVSKGGLKRKKEEEPLSREGMEEKRERTTPEKEWEEKRGINAREGVEDERTEEERREKCERRSGRGKGRGQICFQRRRDNFERQTDRSTSMPSHFTNQGEYYTTHSPRSSPRQVLNTSTTEVHQMEQNIYLPPLGTTTTSITTLPLLQKHEDGEREVSVVREWNEVWVDEGKRVWV